jgi:hypothetical protein
MNPHFNTKHLYSISSSSSRSSFGPQLGKCKQIEVNKKVKKLIHYDCNNNNFQGDLANVDDDVPEEDEIYVKENLLTKKNEDLTE